MFERGFVILFSMLLGFVLGMLLPVWQDTPVDSQVITECEAQVTVWKAKYRDLRRQKRVVIPIPIYRLTDCDTALETCEGSLTAIKLWCDAECKQNLSECLESLQAAYELNRGFYSQEF